MGISFFIYAHISETKLGSKTRAVCISQLPQLCLENTQQVIHPRFLYINQTKIRTVSATTLGSLDVTCTQAPTWDKPLSFSNIYQHKTLFKILQWMVVVYPHFTDSRGCHIGIDHTLYKQVTAVKMGKSTKNRVVGIKMTNLCQ